DSAHRIDDRSTKARAGRRSDGDAAAARAAAAPRGAAAAPSGVAAASRDADATDCAGAAGAPGAGRGARVTATARTCGARGTRVPHLAGAEWHVLPARARSGRV